MVKSPCCEKINVKRGVQSEEEDGKILAFVSKHGSSNWTSVPKKSGIKKCGKSCRLKWNNYLKHDPDQDSFTPQEEDLIIKLHAAIGSRWSIIAQQLPGRTDNDVKNYWNSKLKKKLSQMGIDPVTHKLFSKLIADYGNIGGSQKPSSSIGSFDKDFKNAIQLRSEPYQTLPQQGSRNNTNGQQNQPPTSPLKIETIGNSFSISTSHSDNLPMVMVPGASNCIDLENETIPKSIYEEGGPCLSKTSSPSASSTCSTSAQEALLPVPFSWNDFLLEDAFVLTGDEQEQEIVGGFMSNDLVSQIENVTRQSWNKKETMSSSSSDISFLEAMLDQENEMFLSFPHLMEEPSNY